MPMRRGKKPRKIPGPGPCPTCGGAKWVTKGKGRARILCPGCNGSGTTEPHPAPDKL